MPFALVVIGLIMIVTGAKNTHRDFGRLITGDFTGPGNFTYWLAALGAVGALGYAEQLRAFSRLFMALIIVAMILANGGFFTRLQAALATGPIAPPRPEPAPRNSTLPPTGNPLLDGIREVTPWLDFLFRKPGEQNWEGAGNIWDGLGLAPYVEGASPSAQNNTGRPVADFAERLATGNTPVINAGRTIARFLGMFA